MKPIDILGFGPTRAVRNNEDGTYTIDVTPPAIVSSNTCSVVLTADQFTRYQKWLNEGLLMQDALPELSPAQREALMTGLADDEFPADDEEEHYDPEDQDQGDPECEREA